MLLLHNRTGSTDWQGHRTLIPCETELAEAWAVCGMGWSLLGNGQSRAHNDRMEGPQSSRVGGEGRGPKLFGTTMEVGTIQGTVIPWREYLGKCDGNEREGFLFYYSLSHSLHSGHNRLFTVAQIYQA